MRDRERFIRIALACRTARRAAGAKDSRHRTVYHLIHLISIHPSSTHPRRYYSCFLDS